MKTLTIIIVMSPIIAFGQQKNEVTMNLEKLRDDASADLATAKELLQLKERLGRAVGKCGDLQLRLDEAKSQQETRDKELEQVRKQYRELAWTKAIGRRYNRLANRETGKVYEDVVIKDITEVEVKILHRGGTTTLDVDELPEDLVFEFDIDVEASRLAAKKRKEDPGIPAPVSPPAPGPGSVAPGDGLGTGRAGSPRPGGPPSAGEPKEPKLDEVIEKGQVTARVVRFVKGAKEVEFTVHTNCPATLKIYHVLVPYRRVMTVPVRSRKKLVVTYKVVNDYSCILNSRKGVRLDAEGARKKTKLGPTPKLGE